MEAWQQASKEALVLANGNQKLTLVLVLTVLSLSVLDLQQKGIMW